MSMFESVAKFFATLSPRAQRVQDHRPAVQLEQPSTPPRSRPGRNSFPESDDTQPEVIFVRDAGTTAHPESVHSYVDTIFSPSGPPITSQRSHTRVSYPVLDPRDRLEMFPRQPAGAQKLTMTPVRRTGHSMQMLNNDPKKNSRDRQDEARLLGGSYKDPQAVKIKTGATMQSKSKKPGSNYSFSPSDKISAKSRTSGPVHARGKSNRQTSNMRQNPILLDDAFEESNRPNKRQRQSDVGLEAAGANTLVDRPQQPPLSSPLQSLRTKHKGSAGLPQNLDEFQEVERNVRMSPSPRRSHIRQFAFSGSPDEQFIEKAVQQRRDTMKGQANDKSKGASEALVMDRIEVGAKKSDKARSANFSNATRPSVNGRESPDELQGDITTHSLLNSLTEKPVKAGRQSRIEIHPEPVTRKRSPSDIQPTDFSSPPQDKKKAKRSHLKPARKRVFKASYYRMGLFYKTCAENESVPINVIELGLQLGQDLGPGNERLILYKDIGNILVGEGTSRKISLSMRKDYGDSSKSVDIEFCTPAERNTMLKALELPNVGQEFRDAKDMDKVFAAHASDFAGVSDQTRASLHDRTGGSIPTKANRRLKLADQLRGADGVIVDAKLSKSKRRRKAMMGSEDGTVESRDTSPVQARRQRSPPYAKPFKSILKDQGDQPPESDADAGPEIPVKPLGPTTRETRSSRRAPGRHSRMNEDGLHDTDQKSPLEDDAFRENWKKPLVYPPNGAKKAEVNLDDRDRLREDTFLNDNLIAFYMRFLQDHLERTNKDAARRIYFFNSYFFATLTNPPRGKRDINYKGVEKWTRSVDLFSYDYILVPINEHHHWYIAIICNLPSLSFENAEPVESVQPSRASSPTKQPAPIPETKVQEIDETPEPELKPESNKTFERSPENNVEQSSKPPKEPETRRRLASLSIEEKELAEKYTKNPEGKEQPSSDEGQDADENPTSSPANLSKISAQKLAQDEAAASQPIGKSRKKRSGQKLHPNQPTIITFDSLDVSRSPTIRILREYISLEAISKRGLEINTSEIKGMRGQGIPSQPNWSDCGLYLLAYVEKFIQSPDWFITKVLQRSMDSENDWPRLRSGELRIRLRTFLDELYEEQSQTSRDPKKRIMADRSPIDFLLRPPRPHQEDDADIDVVPESQHEPQKETEAPPTIPTKESTPVDSAACKVPDEQSEDSTVDQMHMVPTESPPAPKPKAPKTRTEKPQTDRSSHAKNEPVIQVPCSQEEPEVSIPRTPPPAEAPRKRKSPRGPRKG